MSRVLQYWHHETLFVFLGYDKGSYIMQMLSYVVVVSLLKLTHNYPVGNTWLKEKRNFSLILTKGVWIKIGHEVQLEGAIKTVSLLLSTLHMPCFIQDNLPSNK